MVKVTEITEKVEYDDDKKYDKKKAINLLTNNQEIVFSNKKTLFLVGIIVVISDSINYFNFNY